ncbi:MAG: hypothetical protein Kow00114_14600 [Kiloniellaceae bacterium]
MFDRHPLRALFRNALCGLALGLGLAAPAEAASLGELLRQVAGNPGHGAPCLRPAAAVAAEGVPLRLPAEPCAAQALSGLYLGVLRDRERLESLRAAIARQRDLMAAVQRRLRGDGAGGELLLAELELNRWQAEETRLIAGLLHAELFFATVMGSDPSEMIQPHFAPSAWPAGEAEALALLAQQKEEVPEDLAPELRVLLQHAWIDYEGARRELALLESMTAFAEDLAKIAHDGFERGETALAWVQERFRDAGALEDARVITEYRLTAVQLQILEIIGRRSAIE